jgi:hypothetical protein
MSNFLLGPGQAQVSSASGEVRLVGLHHGVECEAPGRSLACPSAETQVGGAHAPALSFWGKRACGGAKRVVCISAILMPYMLLARESADNREKSAPTAGSRSQ